MRHLNVKFRDIIIEFISTLPSIGCRFVVFFPPYFHFRKVKVKHFAKEVLNTYFFKKTQKAQSVKLPFAKWQSCFTKRLVSV